MKKIYIIPTTQVVEIEYRGVLAQSFGNPAVDPAHVPELEDMLLDDDLQEMQQLLGM
jgi:hypothetical protein